MGKLKSQSLTCIVLREGKRLLERGEAWDQNQSFRASWRKKLSRAGLDDKAKNTYFGGLSVGGATTVGAVAATFRGLVDTASLLVEGDEDLALRAAVTCGGSCSTCFIASTSSFLRMGECLGGRGGGGDLGSMLKTAWGGGGSGPAVACRPGW